MENLTQVLRTAMQAAGLECRTIIGDFPAVEAILTNGQRLIVSQSDSAFWVRYPDGKVQCLPFKKNTFTGDSASVEANEITSPALGKIMSVSVADGDNVVKNQVLMKIESMKMEIEIKARVDSVVDKVMARTGDVVKYGQILVSIRKSSND